MNINAHNPALMGGAPAPSAIERIVIALAAVPNVKI
jgi:hypothetical protein|tara:strand:- start:995 stop:1102 length:108 start_codon:yes stop_codon:yes gene_type:complete